MILKEDLDLILLAISQYINVNNITGSNLKNNLKDYLDEVYYCGLIKHNPINYNFEIIDDDVIVYLELDCDIIKFVINKTESYYNNMSQFGE